MTGFGLAESAALAREALAGGRPVVLAVVVGGPDANLLGRRVAWDGASLHGDLRSAARNAAAAEILRGSGAEAVCVTLADGTEIYVERIEPPAELVIVGAGHIAQPLARIGKLLGWRVTVLDDRPEFARRERFPDADRVIVADFSDPFAGVVIHSRTRLVLVTRGHRYDYDCLRMLAAMDVEPAYVGMIGSRRRVRAAFESLAREGFDGGWLARIHAPIGLHLGAETPAEIAVAIAAEMVLADRGGSGEPLRDVARVVRYVTSLTEAGVAGDEGESGS